MNQLSISSFSYEDDLTPRYQALSGLPGFVLLESSDKQRGRYDILSAYPYDELIIPRHTADLDDVWAQLKAKTPQEISSSDLPFQGGAIGYLSYDFGAALSGLFTPVEPENDMPLVDMRWYDWAIVTDHWMKQVHLVAAHRMPETGTHLLEITARWHDASGVSVPFLMSEAFVPLITKDAYDDAFHAIHQDIKKGRAYQVNYTHSFLGRYQGDPWGMYHHVRQQNPVPYSAFMRCKDGDILSFSPEQFIEVDNAIIRTAPIKGTAHRSFDAKIDEGLLTALVTSEKNRAENVMIVDLLRNDLGKLALPGSVRVTSLCEAQSFKSVHHLVSQIEADCALTISPWDVFASCFPGGSITGAPKREAMRIIDEQERRGRGVYCGSIMYLSSHGRLDSNIAIRTVTAKEETLYLSAGGGIVMDSVAEEEYHECFTKISAIVNAI